MSDTPAKSGRVHFDPTINLGHILTTVTFLVVAVTGWANIDSRVGNLEREANSLKAKDAEVVREAREAATNVENRLIREVTTQRVHTDQTQGRVADDIREIKTIVREGFRDLDAKLDKKADKLGR